MELSDMPEDGAVDRVVKALGHAYAEVETDDVTVLLCLRDGMRPAAVVQMATHDEHEHVHEVDPMAIIAELLSHAVVMAREVGVPYQVLTGALERTVRDLTRRQN